MVLIETDCTQHGALVGVHGTARCYDLARRAAAPFFFEARAARRQGAEMRARAPEHVRERRRTLRRSRGQTRDRAVGFAAAEAHPERTVLRVVLSVELLPAANVVEAPAEVQRRTERPRGAKRRRPNVERHGARCHAALRRAVLRRVRTDKTSSSAPRGRARTRTADLSRSIASRRFPENGWHLLSARVPLLRSFSLCPCKL